MTTIRPWERVPINDETFRLSEREPIRVQQNNHTEKLLAKYDMHYGLELGIVLSGRMRRIYQPWQIEVEPGDVWFHGMWEPHGWEPLVVPSKTLVVAALPHALVNMGFEEAPHFNWIAPFTVPPEMRPRTAPHLRAEVLSAAERLATKATIAGQHGALWLRLLLLELLMILRENWSPPSQGIALPPNAYSRINRAVEMVLYGHRPATAGEAANACGMGRNAFNKLFEGLMGITFAKFSLRYRVSGAAAQLLRTQDPVKVIASNWGFTDVSHLHRSFLKHYGCSPAEYRRKYL
jgi:AraC-like DNA-binding protein